MPRWLIPLLTVLALLVQSASTFAAAGTTTTTHCCCPSVEVCKCHEHEDHDSEASMKRCGGGEHEVLPELAVTILVDPPVAIERSVAAVDLVHVIPAFETIPGTAPDKPPF